jgi:hypothetical protein
MGGVGSGRWGGRPTVGSGLSLDINKLLRDGSITRNATTTGTLAWSRYGEQVASIGYQAVLGPERGHIRLSWTRTDHSGQKKPLQQWIELESKRQPLGGRRWWLICPRRGHFVSKLYMPGGTAEFASQRAYRLAYRSQRESPRDRAISRAWKARERLTAIGGIGDPCLRPKGMRYKTYDRLMLRVDHADAVVDHFTGQIVANLMAKTGERWDL